MSVEQKGLLNTAYDIHIMEGATPISFPARRVPPKVLPLLRQELQRMTDDGIIRPISEPTDWRAAMVIAYKKDGSLRCCADLRSLNRYIKRSTMQISTFEELCTLHFEVLRSSVY